MPRWKSKPFRFPLRGVWCLGALLSCFQLFSPIKIQADEPSTNSEANWMVEATNHLGQWIWDTNTFDKQTVRFWKEFEIPAGKITNAVVRITVDNGYLLFLDGQELGRGSDWHTVTKYDITRILSPGRHVMAVEGFNDRLEGGLIFGLFIERAGAPPVEVDSDKSWFIVPASVKNWQGKKSAPADSHPVLVIGGRTIIRGKSGRSVWPWCCR